MVWGKRALGISLVLATALGGCGLTTPDKHLFVDDKVPAKNLSPEGIHENEVIGHIRCEIANGVYKAKELGVAWFSPFPKKTVDAFAPKPAKPVNLGWGALVTLKLQVQDQSGLNPGVSLTKPLENAIFKFPSGGNVTSPQSFSLGLGLTAGATATRVETISFTYVFSDIISEKGDCKKLETGLMIESDLKIEQFITDKATIAVTGEAASGNRNFPPYSAFQDDITFVISYGGNATPTWKLASVTANSTSPAITAARTSTDEVIITLGPVTKAATLFAPAQLSTEATTIHTTSLIGTATSSATTAQVH
jgi:hypothetical protein